MAIFDLDRTVSRIPTFTPFLLHAILTGRRSAILDLPRLVLPIAKYASGLLDRKAVKQAMHRAALGERVSSEEAHKLAARFADRFLARHIYPQALAKMLMERAAGAEVWIATAAPRLYAAQLGRRLCVDEVIATGNIWEDGWLTPLIDGDNCYGEAKLAAICRVLHHRGITRDHTKIRFYSDDASDLPTFEWADEPVAVNPSRALRRIAAERRWPIMDWRGPARLERAA